MRNQLERDTERKTIMKDRMNSKRNGLKEGNDTERKNIMIGGAATGERIERH